MAFGSLLLLPLVASSTATAALALPRSPTNLNIPAMAAVSDRIADALAEQDFAAFSRLLHPQLQFRVADALPLFELFSSAVHELGPRVQPAVLRRVREGTSRAGPGSEVLSYAHFEGGRLELGFTVIAGGVVSFSIEEDAQFKPLLEKAAARAHGACVLGILETGAFGKGAPCLVEGPQLTALIPVDTLRKARAGMRELGSRSATKLVSKGARGHWSRWAVLGVYQRGEVTIDVDVDGVTARELSVAVRRAP
jgi:hypothetical protein